MTLEKIKRAFIEYMEETHRGNPYPRDFFGCLLSLVVESEPVSQERIMELTGYSQAKVSLTLQKIQLLLPVRKVKKVGDRKSYYEYTGPPTGFLLDILQRRVDVQDLDLSFIETLIDKVKKKSSSHSAFQRFQEYLKNMHLYHSLIHKLRSEGIEPLKQVLEKGEFDLHELPDPKTLEHGTLADFLSTLKNAMSSDDTSPFFEDEIPEDYLILLNDYFTGLKTKLNPLYSQDLANRFIVVHNVLLEGCTTQKRMEQTTLLPRSTISEILVQVEARGIIKTTKKEGSRVKLYQPAISFSDLMFSNIDRIVVFESAVLTQLSKFISGTKQIRPASDETKKFLIFLKDLKNAYSFAQKFTMSIKVGLVVKLKEENDKGFVFF